MKHERDLLRAVFGEKFQLPEDSVERDGLRMALHSSLETLTVRERKVLVLRYGLLGKKLTVRETAKRIPALLGKAKAPRRTTKVVWKTITHYGCPESTAERRKFVFRPHICAQNCAGIEAKALRKMRDPIRSWPLLYCLKGPVKFAKFVKEQRKYH